MSVAQRFRDFQVSLRKRGYGCAYVCADFLAPLRLVAHLHRMRYQPERFQVAAATSPPRAPRGPRVRFEIDQFHTQLFGTAR
jgi:hypothetical protein